MDGINFLKFGAAFVFVISLMVLMGWLARRTGLGGAMPLRPGQRRLRIVETLPLDPRRKLILIERDDQQHLILAGPQGETVVESGIEGIEEAKDLKVVGGKDA